MLIWCQHAFSFQLVAGAGNTVLCFWSFLEWPRLTLQLGLWGPNRYGIADAIEIQQIVPLLEGGLMLLITWQVKFCAAARQAGHSPRMQSAAAVELIVCGTTRFSRQQRKIALWRAHGAPEMAVE